MPKNVIVVGMPRSGTSMLAGIFGRKNFFVAEDPDEELRPGDHINPDGYWEAATLVERNVDVLKAVGFEGHNTWIFDPIQPGQADAIADLDPLPGHKEFVDDFHSHTPWLWKDPRLCYTLPYWWQLMPDPEATGVVLIMRDPEAIYKSFRRLGWRSPSTDDRGELMGRIRDHLEHAHQAVNTLDIPHIVVDYEDFGDKALEIAERMSGFLDVALGPDDLAFDARYDHSTRRGRARAVAERLALRLPRGARRALKSLLPSRVVRLIFPGWNA